MSKAVPFTVTEITQETRLGRMLSAGRLTATMRSKKTEEHITLTLNSMVKDGQWKHVSFAEATHVFIKLGRGEYGSTTIATFYPQKSQIYFNTEVEAYKYVVRNILVAAQTGVNETTAFEIFEEERCGVCGLALTDPISIERGIGPTCLGRITGSVHYKVSRPLDKSGEHLGSSYDTGAVQLPSTDKKGRTVPSTFEQLVALVS